MLARVQTVSVVVRAGKTPRRAISRALQVLQKAGAPLGGVILNRLLRRRASAYYYDPYYEYSYRDKTSGNGVYGAENLKSPDRVRKAEPELAGKSD
jgi:Mrp family chromosome partitioning ATPase